jgi:hypothetical protein
MASSLAFRDRKGLHDRTEHTGERRRDREVPPLEPEDDEGFMAGWVLCPRSSRRQDLTRGRRFRSEPFRSFPNRAKDLMRAAAWC